MGIERDITYTTNRSLSMLSVCFCWHLSPSIFHENRVSGERVHISLQDKKQPECSPAHIQFHVLWRGMMGENYIQISIFNMELLLFFSGTLFINHRSTGSKINIAKRNGCISIKSCIFHFRSLCQRGNHTICVISYRFFSGKLQFICE